MLFVLQHRQRARCEDRIRNLKDAGLTNFPLHGFHQHEIWLQLVFLATELTAWMGLFALTNEQARVWEPKKLRHRLYTIPAILARGGRRVMLCFSHRHPEAGLLIDAMTRLRMLPAPAS
ncbi:MAG: transposase [Leucobacter sp.]